MKKSGIIDFGGMEFGRENHPSIRVRRRAKQMRRGRENERVANNLRGLFLEFFGF